jgi:hypothetical protein
MGSFSHKIARSGIREAHRTELKNQLREQRFVTHMNARWAVITKRFPSHRFYTKGILPEEAPKVKAEGIREVIAVAWNMQPHRSWWEIVPLEQLTSIPDDGSPALFGLRTGPNERTPIKLHPNFTVSEFIPSVEKMEKPSEQLIASLSEVTQMLEKVEEAAGATTGDVA